MAGGTRRTDYVGIPTQGTEPVSAPTQAPELEFRALSQQIRGLENEGRGRHRIQRATALKGIAVVIGPRAPEVADALNYLDARSPLFRSWIERTRARRRLFVVRTTFGDTDSFASITDSGDGPANAETVLLNLTQTFGTRYGVIGLVAHEFGHAAGGLEDGDMGKVGPNQRAQARVLVEAGIGDGALYPYGQDLGGPNAVAHGYLYVT